MIKLSKKHKYDISIKDYKSEASITWLEICLQFQQQ